MFRHFPKFKCISKIGDGREVGVFADLVYLHARRGGQKYGNNFNFMHFLPSLILSGLFFDFGSIKGIFVLIYFTENFVTKDWVGL